MAHQNKRTHLSIRNVPLQNNTHQKTRIVAPHQSHHQNTRIIAFHHYHQKKPTEKRPSSSNSKYRQSPQHSPIHTNKQQTWDKYKTPPQMCTQDINSVISTSAHKTLKQFISPIISQSSMLNTPLRPSSNDSMDSLSLEKRNLLSDSGM